jgi:CRP-like cAMP-binding protein
MTSTSLLTHRIAKINDRLSNLYHHVSTSPAPSPDLLPMALIELGVVSETLQVMMQEVASQNELLKTIQTDVEMERWRSQRLLKLISDGYLVLNHLLQIQFVNPAAITLLKSQEKALIGQPLLPLVHEDDRTSLQDKLAQLKPGERVELTLRFRQQSNQFLTASVVAEKGHDWQKKSSCFYLLLKDFVECQRTLSHLEGSGENPFLHWPAQTHYTGDLIPIEHQRLWIIAKGAVKLTTLSEQGEELLIGLLGRSMIFGSSLTALQVYQAIALTETQLISIPITTVLQSQQLMQTILPLLTQRLQQTEKFLLVYGQMRIEDRLLHLLKLLKQEIGEPAEGGTRLAVRLTHQDLASACGTTRVTITRLLGKLQQQGIVLIDDRRHLIFP